jgi:hypothetical protein
MTDNPMKNVTFRGPHGTPLTIPADEYYRLTETGALTGRQMLDATIDGRSLQDILDDANYVNVITLDNITVDPDTAALFKPEKPKLRFSFSAWQLAGLIIGTALAASLSHTAGHLILGF